MVRWPGRLWGKGRKARIKKGRLWEKEREGRIATELRGRK